MINNEYLDLSKEELIKIINTQSSIISKLKSKTMNQESALRNMIVQLGFIEDKLIYLREHNNTHRKGL